MTDDSFLILREYTVLLLYITYIIIIFLFPFFFYNCHLSFVMSVDGKVLHCLVLNVTMLQSYIVTFCLLWLE